MLGCPDYDILHEEQNADKFAYMNYMHEKREDYVTVRETDEREKQCAIDLPRIALDYPYLKRK